MTNPLFNSKGSFDLGRINNISLLSNSDISDKILTLSHDSEIGKFYLTPTNQILPNIQYQNEIVIGNGKSYFHKSTFINTTSSDSHQIIKTYTIPIPKNNSNKKKLYLSLDVDLYGQSHYENTDKIFDSYSDYNYYNFTTGYNLIGSQSKESSLMMFIDPTQSKIRTCTEGEDEFIYNQNSNTWERSCCTFTAISAQLTDDNSSGISPCDNGLLGDLDCSGEVDMGDMALLMLNLQKQVQSGDPGDLDNSGMIDYGDVALVSLNMGRTVESITQSNYDPSAISDLILNYGICTNCPFDIDNDGEITINDINILDKVANLLIDPNEGTLAGFSYEAILSLLLIDYSLACPGCPTDLNGDGVVDQKDINILKRVQSAFLLNGFIEDEDDLTGLRSLMLLDIGPCSEECIWDINKDGFVDEIDLELLLDSMGVNSDADATGFTYDDLGLLLLEFGPCETSPCKYDLNGDGVIDYDDYILLTKKLGPSDENNYDTSGVADLLLNYGPCENVYDINNDGAVNQDDLNLVDKLKTLVETELDGYYEYTSVQSLLLIDWGSCVDCLTDLNGDGVVDGDDMSILKKINYSLILEGIEGDINGLRSSILLNYGPVNRCIWDLNSDGVVDEVDLSLLTVNVTQNSGGTNPYDPNQVSMLLLDWGPCPGCPTDLNGDGVVDGEDLQLLLNSFTKSSTIDPQTYCSKITEDPSGNVHDNSLCTGCIPTNKYSCTADFRCINDSNGSFNTLQECESSCVAPIKYACLHIAFPVDAYNCIQMASGPYDSLEDCHMSCSPPSVLYSCTGAPDYICESSPTGTMTKSECMTSCVAPPITKYSCSGPPSYMCEEDPSGIYTSIPDCQTTCKSPLRFKCTGTPKYDCIVDSTGPFTSLEDCRLSCLSIPVDRWSCSSDPSSTCPDARRCVPNLVGLYRTEIECIQSCNPQQSINNTSEIGIKKSYPVWSKDVDIDVENLNYKFTHVPGSFTILVNNDNDPIMFGSENRHQYYEDVLGNKVDQLSTTNQYSNNILVLQPNYSSLNNPIMENKVNIKEYPRITSSINSDGDLVLTIEAKSLQYSHETINWFGKVELFVSIT